MFRLYGLPSGEPSGVPAPRLHRDKLRRYDEISALALTRAPTKLILAYLLSIKLTIDLIHSKIYLNSEIYARPQNHLLSGA